MTRDPVSSGPPEEATRTTGAEPTRLTGGPDDRESGPARIPESIGPYRILGVLGQGGMGIVYEAEQASPRRRVALKVVRGGEFVDEARVRMFQREAETLARLKHPNIGAIYESGRTEDGQHFFAMELVRGEHLGHWLARRPGPLDTDELRFRLRLFRKICDAVHYAHQRGVIHRDLKPSNIVIAEMPDASSTGTTLSASMTPEVKILDFGLARITDTDVHAATVLTEVGMIKGTLPYMSPEQARGQADEVDLRTDVYALGIVLYEMLAGQRPYDTARSALLEAVRVICEEPPVPLGQSWSGTRRLDRDVETIVGKALEKEADRRYGSAAAFSEDVERYLGSQPILAHPPSTAYQMRKFAQRNRGLVLGATAVLAALVLGLVTTAWGFRRASEEASRSNQIAAFMKDMIAGAGPHVAQGADAKLLRGILQRTGERVETELEGQPLVEAELRDTIGQTYMEIGDQEEAAVHLEGAYALTRDSLGEDHPRTLDAKRHLAVLRSRSGRRIEAEQLYRETLEAHERTGTGDSVSAVAVRHGLGVLCLETGRTAEAVEILEKCVEERRRLLGPEDNHTFQSMSGLGLALLREGRFEEAEVQLRAVLDGRRRVDGDTHPFTVEAIHNLGGFYDDLQRYDEAEALFLEALEQMEEVYGESHPRTIHVRAVTGTSYLARQRLVEAETHLTRAFSDARELLGEDHPTALMAQQRVARLRQFQRRTEEAETLLVDLLERRRRLFGDSHPHTLASMLSLMQFLSRQKRFEEAAPLGGELVDKGRERWGGEHRDTLIYLNELGHLYTAMKSYEEAERAYLEALEGRRRLLGEDHPHTLVSMNSLAVLFMRQGDYERAIPRLEETLERQRGTIGPDHPDTIISLYNLAHAHNELGEVEKAEELFLQAAAGFEKSLGEQHGNTRAARRALVKLYEKEGRVEEADRWRAIAPSG